MSHPGNLNRALSQERATSLAGGGKRDALWECLSFPESLGDPDSIVAAQCQPISHAHSVRQIDLRAAHLPAPDTRLG